jgi:hypothetical protein
MHSPDLVVGGDDLQIGVNPPQGMLLELGANVPCKRSPSK